MSDCCLIPHVPLKVPPVNDQPSNHAMNCVCVSGTRVPENEGLLTKRANEC